MSEATSCISTTRLLPERFLAETRSVSEVFDLHLCFHFRFFCERRDFVFFYDIICSILLVSLFTHLACFSNVVYGRPRRTLAGRVSAVQRPHGRQNVVQAESQVHQNAVRKRLTKEASKKRARIRHGGSLCPDCAWAPGSQYMNRLEVKARQAGPSIIEKSTNDSHLGSILGPLRDPSGNHVGASLAPSG